MPDYLGKDGFIWWQGVVEDRKDPLYLGRCKVRILGWHTDNKSDMPTESLPWAYPLQPITSAAQTGVGISPTGPVEGTWVVGFYRDGEEGQEPVFFGTLGGIPESPSIANKGFNDPRLDFEEEHPLKPKPKPELKYNPSTENAQVPYSPRKITHYKGATTFPSEDVNTDLDNIRLLTSNPQASQKVVLEEWGTRSTYPRSELLNEPTTPRQARGVSGNYPLGISEGIIGQKLQWRNALTPDGFTTAQQKTRVNSSGSAINYVDKWFEPDPTVIYGAKYPYNHVHQSESGHIMEVDDTPGAERLHRYHRTGTFEEIGSLGQKIVKVVNESFHIGLNNDYRAVTGNQYEHITGKLDVVSKRGYYHNCESGTFSMRADGGISLTGGEVSMSGENITLDAGKGNILLIGHSLTKRFDTTENTDEVKGNATQKVGGSYILRSGSLSMNTRGSTGISAGGDITLSSTGAMQEIIGNLPPAGTAKSTLAAFGDIYQSALLGSVTLATGPLSGPIPLGGGSFAALGSISVSPAGEIELNCGPLGSLAKIKVGLTGIDLSYLSGLSSITIGPAGVEIKGLTVKLGSSTSIQTDVEGVLTNVKGTGITSVSGALVKLN